MRMAGSEIDLWRERALRAEARAEALRDILLDVDAVLNLASRKPEAILARLSRDERPVSRRVQDALLETAQTHCKNWAYGCDPGECNCRCARCPSGSVLPR